MYIERMNHIGGADQKGLRHGRILKGVGGFYTVDEGAGYIAEGNGGAPGEGAMAENAPAHDRSTAKALWECRLRGRFRREKQEVLPGDLVAFAVTDEANRKGVVEEIGLRKNRLVRPPVANVDQALIVLAVDFPQPDFWLLDRLLLMILAEGIRPLLCWNKEDLAGFGELGSYMAPYASAGVTQLMTCALTGIGIHELSLELKGRATVLAGPSGVGKSTLLNQIEPDIGLKTGGVSDKTGRGKHTTRHVEWIPLTQGGWVADTPGFSQLVMPESITSAALADYYPEFRPFLEGCRFRSCLHEQEQDCGVSQGMREGGVDEGRYRRYLSFLRELKEREKRY